MKTYEILTLQRQIEDLENEYNQDTGEFIDNSEKIIELLEVMQDEKENKLKAIIHIIKQKQANIDIYKNEIAQIQATIKQEEKNIITLNDLMGILLNNESVKTNIGSFYFGKESLYIADESKFKQEYPQYIIEKPAIRKELDKSKIIQDIDTIKGAKLRKGVIFRGKKTKDEN